MTALNTSTAKAGRQEGERRKQTAFDNLQAHRECFIRRGQRALLESLLENGTATADDVRSAVDLPEGIDPKCFGSVPGPLARAGIIRADGYAKTFRPTAHARPLTVWRLADRGKAERWLRDHPDLADRDEEPPTPAAILPLQRSLFDGLPALVAGGD